MIKEEVTEKWTDGIIDKGGKRDQAMMLRAHGKAHFYCLHGPMENCHGGLGPRRGQSRDSMWRWGHGILTSHVSGQYRDLWDHECSW